MRGGRWVTPLVAIAVLCACGDGSRRRVDGSDAGVWTFDAAMIGGRDAGPDSGRTADGGRPGSDAGSSAGDCDDLPPSSLSGGVRTAHPHITVYDGSGFAARSVNYVITVDGDSRGPLIEVFVEVENTSSSTECDFLPDVFLGGTELTGLVETPPYFGEFVTTVTNDCLGPGQSGVYTGLARGVTEEMLASVSSLSFDPDPNTIGDAYPATNGPTVLSSEIGTHEEGWGLSGQIRINATIRNYNMTSYARDERGLITAELQSYPRRLEALYVGETVDYETLNGTPCRFDDHLSYQSWIVGAGSTFSPVFAFPTEVDGLQAERRVRMAELRRTR